MTEGDVLVCLSTYDGWQALRQKVEWAGCASSLSVRVHNCHAVLRSHMSAWMGEEVDGLAQLDKNGLLILKTYFYALHFLCIHFTNFCWMLQNARLWDLQ